MKIYLFLLLIIFPFFFINAQFDDSKMKTAIPLWGKWQIIIDPYENGFYNYRYEENKNGFFKNEKPKSKTDLIEYDFDKSETLFVPGDWNSQKKELFFYEGTVWYKKSIPKLQKNQRYFLHFGAVNYKAIVYLNGEKLGEHIGGFTPFKFEITNLVKEGENFVVVKVDNKRVREGVPTLNTDWWNYGGITRDVSIESVPEIFIEDYFIQLDPKEENKITGYIKLNGSDKQEEIKIKIKEAGIEESFTSDDKGFCKISFDAKLQLWSPESPKLYPVVIETDDEIFHTEIGFRRIEAKGTEILLNGKPIFLKGISIHEEAPIKGGRATNWEDANNILKAAKELGCNFVRLAHYPHSENMTKLADKMGLMVWSEIPVYWTILWDNKDTYNLASQQLKEMITRDKNRASVIIWSVANETPRGEKRLEFLKNLITEAKQIDNTRLISAATELTYKGKEIFIDDPLSEYLDIIGANEYIGWYSHSINEIKDFTWKSNYNKPLIISEFGADAKYGLHGDEQTRWTEEYQNAMYREQLNMLSKIDFLRGISPWILFDFRSPRRQLPGIQDYYNRKGLISNDGNKKQAFYTLQEYYKNK